MSEHLHRELHPDPDSLNAFIEGVLPEHERLQCLAHLAECSRCREVVFLAQKAPPAPAAPSPVPAWRRWFAPVPVLATAAAACFVVLAVSLYLHYTAVAPTRDMVAQVSQAPAAPAPSSVPDLRTEAHVPALVMPKVTPDTQPLTKLKPDRAAPALPAARDTISAKARTMTPPELAPPPPIPASPDTIQNQQLLLPPALLSSVPLPSRPPSVNIKDDRSTANSLSGISGTVTDATGAAIPGATIKLRQLAGTISSDARTDVTGQFKLAGLPAGRYELQITAPGFRQTLKQIDLQPREMAAVQSELEIGAVTETVEVTAASSTMQTAATTARVERRRKTALPEEPRPLPSKLPATITLRSGKTMLAVDSAGAVFVSRNAGKSWKTVRPVWPGKVHLVTIAEPSKSSTANFQLTTESGSKWLSGDGSHWYPAPPQH